jgi:hypothetical protein
MPEQLDPMNATYVRLLSRLLLDHLGLALDVAGLADFLTTNGTVSPEALNSHLQAYRERHEQAFREEIIGWLREAPTGIDPVDLFGSSPQSPDEPPPPATP